MMDPKLQNDDIEKKLNELEAEIRRLRSAQKERQARSILSETILEKIPTIMQRWGYTPRNGKETLHDDLRNELSRVIRKSLFLEYSERRMISLPVLSEDQYHFCVDVADEVLLVLEKNAREWERRFGKGFR